MSINSHNKNKYFRFTFQCFLLFRGMYKHATSLYTNWQLYASFVVLGHKWLFKRELHPKPKLSMFCALSQKCQHFFRKYYKQPKANCLRNSKLELKFQ